jgi:hypothetical protein
MQHIGIYAQVRVLPALTSGIAQRIDDHLPGLAVLGVGDEVQQDRQISQAGGIGQRVAQLPARIPAR